MKGIVRTILPLKPAKNAYMSGYGKRYTRVTFKMEDGKWAKTDLCPEYRNFRNWTKILKAGEGIVVEGLTFKKAGEVDADSPVFISKIQEIKKEKFKCIYCKGAGMCSEGNLCSQCDGAGWVDTKQEKETGQVSLFKETK